MCSYETLSILMCKVLVVYWVLSVLMRRVLVSKACTTIKREVCQPRRRKKTQNLVENRT